MAGAGCSTWTGAAPWSGGLTAGAISRLTTLTGMAPTLTDLLAVARRAARTAAAVCLGVLEEAPSEIGRAHV